MYVCLYVHTQGRDHASFVMRLREVVPSREGLVAALLAAYHDHFVIQVSRRGGLTGTHVQGRRRVEREKARRDRRSLPAAALPPVVC